MWLTRKVKIRVVDSFYYTEDTILKFSMKKIIPIFTKYFLTSRINRYTLNYVSKSEINYISFSMITSNTVLNYTCSMKSEWRNKVSNKTKIHKIVKNCNFAIIKLSWSSFDLISHSTIGLLYFEVLHIYRARVVSLFTAGFAENIRHAQFINKQVRRVYIIKMLR